MKNRILVAIAATALIVSGCVSTLAFDAKNPLVSYYAAVADFNGAKSLALAYVSIPSTTKAEAVVVDNYVKKGDKAIGEIEVLRAECADAAPSADTAVTPSAATAARNAAIAACLPTTRLEAVGKVLQVVASELRARVLKGNK
jgi:hypothetical protein